MLPAILKTGLLVFASELAIYSQTGLLEFDARLPFSATSRMPQAVPLQGNASEPLSVRMPHLSNPLVEIGLPFASHPEFLPAVANRRKNSQPALRRPVREGVSGDAVRVVELSTRRLTGAREAELIIIFR